MDGQTNVISFSGGKDSTATVILAHEHGIPAKVVMACLWFDREKGIPAIDVDHWNFIQKKIVPTFEKWGYPVEFVDAKHDYLDLFNHCLSERSLHVGLKKGYLIPAHCDMANEKINAIKSVSKKYAGITSIQGIASDETSRLETLHNKGGISLLEKYDYTEYMAFGLCRKYDLLSPIYARIHRDGCWFCPNQSIKEWADLKSFHPELWAELKSLSYTPNLVSNYFDRNGSFADLERKVDLYIDILDWQKKQISFFEEEK